MNKEILKKFADKQVSIPGEQKLSNAIKSFSPAQRIVFFVAIFLMCASSLTLFLKVNNALLVTVPEKGGRITEGVLGSPRFINPLLATSETDRDITSLVYSGLMKPGVGGELIPDLAESLEISEDGLYYSFVIKSDARFHDGKPVTSDDVEFTIQKAQDPNLKSPRRGSWEGVAIEKISSKEIRFVLRQPYSPFLENTTIGILPKHVWKDVTADEFSFSQYNTEPIGSGPYEVSSIKRNSSGIPSEYDLKSFNDYVLGEPYILKIKFKFYPNERDLVSALKKKDVDSVNSLSPQSMKELENAGFNVDSTALPRIFGVFFNQNQASVFTNKEVRVALDMALDKQKIIDDVLFGFGKKINGPALGLQEKEEVEESFDGIAKAREHLESNGWEFSSTTNVYGKKSSAGDYALIFSIATGDAPELKNAAMSIKEQWEEMGAQVDVQIFEIGDLNQNIIRPRRYDALFFGEVIGRDMDLYPFWHSSQRNDPGLNIAVYVNNTVDRALENIRSSINQDEREESFETFLEEIKNDQPAVFTYSPDFIYVYPKKINDVVMTRLTMPNERFLNVHNWYIETNRVWKIFAKNKKNIIN